MDTPKLLRVSEVAKVFNVSRPTVYRMVKAGQLPAYSIAGSVRIPAEAVQRYLDANQVCPVHAPMRLPAPAAPAPPPGPRPRGTYAAVAPDAGMLAERQAWQIARRMALKLVPADATDAQWDAALQAAYRTARAKIDARLTRQAGRPTSPSSP
ncbi:MAG: helix-turn-helix domain-containing protein [Planctomycetes bacterium]|nr:helix-turn-helix domain-containing protein [Planctomycetota bacterium]